jgi:hypothetical protein
MKKTYLLAVACYLAIPFAVVGGGFAAVLINPEWAIHTTHYSRNFHLLNALKGALFFSGVGLGGILWFLMCYCLVKSKQRSMLWLAFAFLGPLGIPVLAALRDAAPIAGDAWQRLIQRTSRAARIACDLAFFLAAWTVSYQAMVLLRNFRILLESMTTGAPVAQIVAQQNAGGGMYAFVEGNEVMYFVTLIYLFWPIAFNLLARLRSRENILVESLGRTTQKPSE